MLKNTKLKKFLKSTIFKAISFINRFLPKKDNIILLHMGNKWIGFNLFPLYDYLILNHFNEKYTIVCSVEAKEYFEKPEYQVIYVTHMQAIKWFLKARHVFYTAGQLPIKPSKKQIVIHLNHGISDYKTIGALTKINNGDEFFFTYMIASSPLYVPIIMKAYLCKEENVKICSEPMVDRILNPLCKYDFSKYNKVLLWVPTFRQSDYLGYDDSSHEDLLPLFCESEYHKINELLIKYNILMITKIHPSQSIKHYKKTMLSHLKIYSHEDFIKDGYNLYDLMAQVDGLIGDYSSVSLQFLLTNKPLAYVIPDFKEYEEKRGFVFDNPKEYMPGHLITSVEGFIQFLQDFSAEKDIYQEERIKIKNLIHTYQDGNSCERILCISQIH